MTPGAYAAKGCIARGVPANLPSRRMGATGCFVAIWRMEIGELAVDHAVADGRKVGGGPKAPSVSTSADYPSQEPTSGSSCGYRMGLAALGRARIPVANSTGISKTRLNTAAVVASACTATTVGTLKETVDHGRGVAVTSLLNCSGVWQHQVLVPAVQDI